MQLLPSTQDGSGRVDLQEILDWLLYASWFLQKFAGDDSVFFIGNKGVLVVPKKPPSLPGNKAGLEGILAIMVLK